MARPVSELNNIFKHLADADRVNRFRGIRNTLATAGVNGGQFSDTELMQLASQGLDMDGYNFLIKFVKGLSGAYISNWFDPKFSPSSDSEMTLDTARFLEEIYLSDKDRNDYKYSAMKAIWNGLIYRGVEEIYIKRPKLSDPKTWSIGFRPVRADSIIFDQGNTEDRISRSSTKCCRYNYYSYQQIEAMYPQKKKEMAEVKAKFAAEGDNKAFDQAGGMRQAPLNYLEETRNNRLQVVEYYEVINTRVKQDQHIPTGKLIPDTPFKHGTPEDIASKKLWGAQNGITITDDDIFTIEEVCPKLMVDVWIPSMDLMLDSGEDERQLNGNLPFYAYSYLEMEGVSVSLVDTLWSSQKDINKREKAKTKWIEDTPVPRQVYHPDFFGGNTAKAKQELARSNDASSPMVCDASVAPGRQSSLIGMTPSATVPSHILQDEATKVNFLNEISGVTPAMLGQTGNSAESGYAYTQKVIEGSVGQKYPQESLIQHEHDKVTDWLILVPKVYGGPANYGKRFSVTGDGGRDFIVANEFKGYDGAGEPVVLNDLAKVERVDVTIGKTSESEFAKQARRSVAGETRSKMTPTKYNEELITILDAEIVSNLDYSTDDARAQARAASDRSIKLARLATDTQIASIEAQGEQADTAALTAVAQSTLVPVNTMVQQSQAELALASTEMQKQQVAQQMQGGGQPQQGQPQPQAQPEQMQGAPA